MKKIFFTGGAYLCLVAGACAVTNFPYFETFDSFFPKDSNVAGKGGWTINNVAGQYSFVSQFGVSYGLGLGDASMVLTPPTPGTTVSLMHSGIGPIGKTDMTFQYEIFDSNTWVTDPLDPENATNRFRNRDNFGISLTVGSTNLLSIVFSPAAEGSLPEPLSTGPTPADPTADVNARWVVDYTSAYGSGTLNMQFLEANLYTFRLECTPSGSDTMFTLSLDGGNTRSDTKTLTGLDPATFTDTVKVNWSSVGDNAFGSNAFYLDNLSIIPEPSVSLLLCLAGLGFVTRRRRA